MSYKISSLTQSDLITLNELTPDGWNDITATHEHYIKAEYCIPVKVDIDGRTAGIGTIILFKDSAWLAYIIVHPDFRRRGIALEIVEYLVELARKKGYSSISLIATHEGHPVYLKAGFREQSDYIFFNGKTLPSKADLSPYITPLSVEKYQGACELDRKVTGENRAAFFGDKWKSGYVFIRNDEIKGVYLPDVGDGLIVAVNDEAGTALMKLRLTQKERAVVPEENTVAIAYLQSNGFSFSESDRAKRMIIGPEFPWQPKKIYNRISGSVG